MLNPLSMTDKTILVTGASSGIGRAISILLSQLGARLILVARNEERLQMTSTLLDGEGHLSICKDLSVSNDLSSWMKSIADEQGSLDGLVHAAGVQLTLPLRSLNKDDFDRIMKINFNAAVWLTKAFRQNGVHNKLSSSIVYISSVAGIVGELASSIYGCSKAALISLAKSLSLELAKKNIRVNCVSPALVKTDITENFLKVLTEKQLDKIIEKHPLGIGLPEDVANAAVFLLSDASRWITGTNLVVDGGYTVR